MKRCVTCGHEGLVDDHAEDSIRVGGQLFTAVIGAQVCPNCHEAYFGYDEIGRFEGAVAVELAREGRKTPEAFAFMRKALGMRSVELAELLDVTPETISRWEHGKVALEHRATALLGAMVLDQAENKTATVDRLRALKQNRDAPSTVKLGQIPRHA